MKGAKANSLRRRNRAQNTAPRVLGQERLKSLKAAWPTTSEKISHQIEAALFARPIFGAREARSLKGNKAATCEKNPHLK